MSYAELLNEGIEYVNSELDRLDIYDGTNEFLKFYGDELDRILTESGKDKELGRQLFLQQLRETVYYENLFKN